jgi:hypothetical protein
MAAYPPPPPSQQQPYYQDPWYGYGGGGGQNNMPATAPYPPPYGGGYDYTQQQQQQSPYYPSTPYGYQYPYPPYQQQQHPHRKRKKKRHQQDYYANHGGNGNAQFDGEEQGDYDQQQQQQQQGLDEENTPLQQVITVEEDACTRFINGVSNIVSCYLQQVASALFQQVDQRYRAGHPKYIQEMTVAMTTPTTVPSQAQVGLRARYVQQLKYQKNMVVNLMKQTVATLGKGVGGLFLATDKIAYAVLQYANGGDGTVAGMAATQNHLLYDFMPALQYMSSKLNQSSEELFEIPFDVACGNDVLECAFHDEYNAEPKPIFLECFVIDVIKDAFAGTTSATNNYLPPIIGTPVLGAQPVLSEDGKVSTQVLNGVNLLFDNDDAVITQQPGITTTHALASREMLKANITPFITTRLTIYAQTYATKSRGEEEDPNIPKALEVFRGLKTQETMRIVDTVKEFMDPMMTRMSRIKKNQRKTTRAVQDQMANMMNWQLHAQYQTQAFMQNQLPGMIVQPLQQQYQSAAAASNNTGNAHHQNQIPPPPGQPNNTNNTAVAATSMPQYQQQQPPPPTAYYPGYGYPQQPPNGGYNPNYTGGGYYPPQAPPGPVVPYPSYYTPNRPNTGGNGRKSKHHKKSKRQRDSDYSSGDESSSGYSDDDNESSRFY